MEPEHLAKCLRPGCDPQLEPLDASWTVRCHLCNLTGAVWDAEYAVKFWNDLERNVARRHLERWKQSI
jgi:hypothetical protein